MFSNEFVRHEVVKANPEENLDNGSECGKFKMIRLFIAPSRISSRKHESLSLKSKVKNEDLEYIRCNDTLQGKNEVKAQIGSTDHKNVSDSDIELSNLDPMDFSRVS